MLGRFNDNSTSIFHNSMYLHLFFLIISTVVELIITVYVVVRTWEMLSNILCNRW